MSVLFRLTHGTGIMLCSRIYRCQHLLSRLKVTTRTRYFSDSKLNITVNVISSGGLGTPKSVLVKVSPTGKQEKTQTDNGYFYTPVAGKRYLFNCGEGTQRSFILNMSKKNTIEDILITVTNWENLGGLKGLFTERAKYEGASEMFRKELKLYGPELMLDRFYVGKDPFYSVVNATTDMFHEDEYVQIKYVPIFPELSDEDLKDYPAHVIEQTKNWKIEGAQPKLKRKLSSIVYILKVLEDNSLPTIMILECPDQRYIKSLLESEDLKKHQSEHGAFIYHLSPASVMEHPSYKEFINRFDSSNEHIHVDETQEQPSLNHIRFLQTKLHDLDDKVFPLFPSCEHLKQYKGIQNPLRSKKNRMKVLSAKCGHSLRFDGEKMKLSSTIRDPLKSFNRGIKNLNENDENYLQSVKNFVQKQNRDEVVYPVILFLGTSATISTILRNVTGIYLQTDSDTAVLLDCGEGTFIQMCLHFGNQTNEMLRKIKCIFISHLHADHIAGLAGILKQRHLAFKEIGVPVEPVDIIGEDDMHDLVTTIAHFVPNIMEETEIHQSRHFRSKGYFSKIHEKLKLRELRTVKALHNNGRAHSVSIRHKDGWHLVFSGDTLPSVNLKNLGKNCDILIHEATYPSTKVDLARMVSHSTVADAVQTSREMKAKKTILTHFSPKALLDEKKLILSQTNITIAMDHMKVQMSDLDYTPLYNPFLLDLVAFMSKQRHLS